MDILSFIISIASIAVAIFTLSVARDSLKVSKDLMILTLSDSYDNKLAKLLAFARKSADKIEEMLNANQTNGNTYTKDDFYRESGFIEHFETYHILSDFYLSKIDESEGLQKKVELIRKVRSEIYNSRNIFRDAKNNPALNSLITKQEVDTIKNALIKIRNDIIKSQK